ncbi:hypothetical protein ASPZODRAFT_142408 [Penicilliopsis zonata CBS 506.65]|uniref:Uncharacterized protein n=1 Tax=Penicilliopsis zonata CBS 506.65 TaxID=1073090 RepID=A0A1L9SHK0_9EURO|nr:hypothetical protein ASPZODRAFT_142408 [Penicilliopsis zonata CBS 506.65]OJJ46601.1 hypothetical protein ASPZODRAFT_142408 [Penicilliopsis zonata CBS 506.65]
MNFSPQDLVHYFSAAAGAFPLDKPGIYLVSEDEEDLVEKLWTGTEIKDEFWIAGEIRTNSPALYLLKENDRRVLCVDQDNNLLCFTWDAEEDGWNQVTLDSSESLAVHASSHLSGCYVPEGQIVFFEDPSGSLQKIRIDDNGVCERLPSLVEGYQSGTPHCAVISEAHVLHLLYVHQDHSIHDLAQGLRSGEWRDTALPGTQARLEENEQIIKFMPIPKHDLSFELIALTSSDALVRIDNDGSRIVLGKVVNGRFMPTSTEECVIETMRLIKKGVKAVSGGLKTKK